MALRRRLFALASGAALSGATLVIACSTDTAPPSDELPDSAIPARRDASTSRADGGEADADAPADSGTDGAKSDAGKSDAGKSDGGPTDSGAVDSGPNDAAVDAGPTTSLFLRGDFATNDKQALGVALVPLGASTPVVQTFAIGTQVQAFDVTPDGTKIVVAADLTVTGRYDLVVANRDGSSPATLATMPATGAVSEIVISPDGTKVAYLADAELDGAPDAYVVAVTGGTPAKVSPPRAAASTALRASTIAWSRDSKFIAVAGDFTTDKRNELVVTDTTAAPVSPAAVLAAADVPAPGVRPSTGVSVGLRPIWTAGGKVCFKADLAVATATYRLYCSSPNGADFAELANQPAAPALLGTYGISPDGAAIALSADSAEHPGAYEIFKMPADGSSAATRISSGALTAAANTNRGPALSANLLFSPDGSMLAYAADQLVDNRFEPYVLPLAGGTERRVAIVGTAGDPERNVQAVAWAPDSSSIAFVADHRANNDFEVFRVLGVTTADQAPVLVRGVPASGDVAEILWRP